MMSISTTPTAPVTVNGEPLEFVQDFTYLGSLISKDNGGQKDIKARLGKARCAFAKLQNIWKSNKYTTKTKIRLYNSNVKSILLYGSECWRDLPNILAKQDFQRGPLQEDGLQQCCPGNQTPTAEMARTRPAKAWR